ncbi:hypothetical protein GOZ81_03885 [Agrobacterium vitis]|uniref:hypothetical protein n=1 Tax=Agrobacterium vitis TaxID=373 RepID=UPI0012E795EE|nr:hypothetical protein [Agrobacterium vitis]MVA70205.1 hypothetical protein [Agrobacterium vitis]
MTDTLNSLDQSVLKCLKNAALGVKLIKGALLVVAGGVASFAQFANWQGGHPSNAEMAGMAASILIVFGGIYALIADRNAPEHLMEARKALQTAKDLEAQLEASRSNYALYESDMLIATNTYLSISVMAQALETMDFAKLSAEEAAGRLLKATQPCLPMALGFETRHHWTVGIYMAETNGEDNTEHLRLIQNLRPIDCDMSKARAWPAGSGFLGLAYTNRKEVVIEDANDPAVATVLGAPPKLTNPNDAKRYISMALVPITVDGDKKPWGVAIATSNAPGHFSLAAQEGVTPIEAVRALSKMVATVISIKRKLEKSVHAHNVNSGEERK